MKNGVKTEVSKAKRVCIATFHRAYNYGAVLQAYALATFLEREYGADVKFLNYRPKDSKAYKMFTRINSIKSVKRNLSILRSLFPTLIERNRFHRFRQRFLRETPLYSSLDDVYRNPPQADICVTGSDQVFRYKTGDEGLYFLPFCKKLGIKSIAYAPSFGSKRITSFNQHRVKELLSDIDHLSCRESSGSEIIYNLTGSNAPVVLDPVFLLEPDEWKSIIGKPIVEGDYILVYALVGYEGQLRIAKKVQKLLNMPIVMIRSQKCQDNSISKCFRGISPLEYLNLFYWSSYVVTDSFHGTAFSLVFRKGFFSFIALEESSSRIMDLLSKLELIDRIRGSYQAIDIENIPINYELVTGKLNEMILSSKRYLNMTMN